MFRFTIRDVLWLTLVIGMGVGWALSTYRWQVAVKSARQETAHTRKALMTAEDKLNEATAFIYKIDALLKSHGLSVFGEEGDPKSIMKVNEPSGP